MQAKILLEEPTRMGDIRRCWVEKGILSKRLAGLPVPTGTYNPMTKGGAVLDDGRARDCLPLRLHHPAPGSFRQVEVAREPHRIRVRTKPCETRVHYRTARRSSRCSWPR